MHEHVTLMPPDARGPTTARGMLVGTPGRSAQPVRRPPPRPRPAVRVRLLHGRDLPGAAASRRIGPDSSGASSSGVPGVIGIVVALLVAAVIRSPRLPLPAAMTLGLVFEIVSSYAIAAAEFGDPLRPRDAPGLPGALLGRRLGRAVHGRRADLARAGRCWRRWPRSARSPSSSGS